MEYRSLKLQYQVLKEQIDNNINQIISDANFISGRQVSELEKQLAEYVGVKHCVTCANGTDALSLAMMTWNIGEGDAVFVPDFTFFSSGEIVSFSGATPIFVDVNRDTCNIDPNDLDEAIKSVLQEGKLIPRVIVAVDLFGQPAEYPRIKSIADKYGLFLLEDSAQGFGGQIGEKKCCSFGDISTTSFFPMKPLGCYGDGGAVFTDNDDWAELIRSYAVHGKGSMKYDNIRIGRNSRLDTIQAAVLLAKLPEFAGRELTSVNLNAEYYSMGLKNLVHLPFVLPGYKSSWAQYTIQLESAEQRNGLKDFLKMHDVPSFIYYPKAMHKQKAFEKDNQITGCNDRRFVNCDALCEDVLSIPISPYISDSDKEEVVDYIREYVNEK